MKTWIGTSGFQYPEWKGKFYPDTLSVARMLGFYAGVFNTTEINYTFRRFPSLKTIERWRSGTPDDFRFSLKAPQRVTHFNRLKDCGPVMKAFQKAAKGLGNKLSPVLCQLPPSLEADSRLLRQFLAVVPRTLRIAMEFRHPSWFKEETYQILRKRNAALCIAESEELATPPEVTANFGYLRLRRLDYTSKELKKWAQLLESQQSNWQEVFVYFKHEETAAGPTLAQKFQKLMQR